MLKRGKDRKKLDKFINLIEGLIKMLNIIYYYQINIICINYLVIILVFGNVI